MKKIVTCLAAALLLVTLTMEVNAQPEIEWEQTYGGPDEDECNDVIQTEDGRFALVGSTESFGEGEEDLYFIRIDRNGDSLWSRTIGGDGSDVGLALAQVADGGFVLAGFTDSFGAGSNDFWLVRLDGNGDDLWSKTYGGAGDEFCYSVIQTESEGFILAGYTTSFGDNYNIWLLCTDENGDSLWSQTYGGIRQDECQSIVECRDGGFAFIGFTNSFRASQDGWLVRTNANGDSLWSRSYGGMEPDIGTSIVETNDGGFAFCGLTNSFGENDNLWFMRVDENGDSLDARAFEGSTGQDLISLSNGGFALIGIVYSSARIYRLDEYGDSLWTATFPRIEYGNSFVRANDESYVIAGSTHLRSDDISLLKTTPDPASVRFPGFILPPSSLSLSTFPSPFNSSAFVSFQTPFAGDVRASLVDVNGREMRDFWIPAYAGITDRFIIDGTGLSAGTYWLRLEQNGQAATTRMVLVK